MAEKIIARFIIQIAGKPEKNVVEALKLVETKLREHELFTVLESEVAEPEYDEETTLYSGFLDLEIRFPGPAELLGFVLDYTPNSVEIVEPQILKLEASELTGIMNDMSSHLLRTSAKIRQLSAQLHHVVKQGQEKK
ncbi:MAG: hypothetical protein H6500_00340 [Candidatus Woesearchaeota archaeon]|nr:hypothetical protein [Nanoarchaeota archaeon]USN44282.1 MAG: hypothetical protein H6500_00340 [Candidatus Woesearchaeota archaeon]